MRIRKGEFELVSINGGNPVGGIKFGTLKFPTNTWSIFGIMMFMPLHMIPIESRLSNNWKLC